ncbi:toll/interleukin-1 receptor domain-containing protein [Streptomyces sp. H51]|uniref:toll/interleukin-1 receptor domain-containing protein n=1 Tax=Streptomyces sp. H51 TaxID=3111770 RepID=UPI002D773EC7|nr:toll/interleukin-1 receptor domain-containing protein [Streptomyces sp. H51]
MDRDGLRTHPDQDWLRAAVQALCASPVLGDRGARATLVELVGDALRRPVVLREQPTARGQLLELVRFCLRAGADGPPALAEAVSLLEGHSRTAESIGDLVRSLRDTRAAEPTGGTVTAAASADRVHFFVSYAATDRRWASWITWQLENAGFRVLVQERDVAAPGGDGPVGTGTGTGTGDAGRPDVRSGVERSERTVPVLSADYLSGPYPGLVWRAVHTGDPQRGSGALLPVLVERCRPPWPLPDTADTAYVDLTGGLTEDEARTRLLAAAAGSLAGHPLTGHPLTSHPLTSHNPPAAIGPAFPGADSPDPSSPGPSSPAPAPTVPASPDPAGRR